MYIFINESCMTWPDITTIDLNPDEHNQALHYYTCTCENGKYFENFISDPVIACVKIIEVTKIDPIKTIPTNFNRK